MAGFANGTYSRSLHGLSYPSDLFVDDTGNMYIVDSWNSRILYWPVNSAEGRIVAGTNKSGWQANQLNSPVALTSNDQYCLRSKHISILVRFSF